MAHVQRRGRTRGWCWPAASPIRWRTRARRRARRRIDDVTIFAGERPATEIPAYLLAADVLVSPRSRGTNTPLKIYQYLRSGKPIVATRLLTHTQVLSDDTAILTDATPARIRRRHCGGARGPGAGRRRRAAGARAGRDEIQLRGVSRADATGLRGARARRSAPRRGGEGRRVTPKPAARPDHYSYTRLRRSGDGARASTHAASAVRSARWSPPRRRACCSIWRARSRTGRFSTSAPEPAARPCCWRAPARASPASTRPRRCSRSRGSGRPTQRLDVPFVVGRRARARVSRSQRSTWPSACAC